MLQALLRNKLQRWLNREAFEIEDLLTSVVIGSCRYLPPEVGLLPFLEKAVGEGGANLAAEFVGVTDIRYEFWPRNLPTGTFRGGAETLAAESSASPGTSGRGEEQQPLAASGEPEVLLEIHRSGRPPALLLLEAKLGNGKSSLPTEGGPVTDQLGKYWIQLTCKSDELRAEALGLVYITAGSTFPANDFEQTQDELTRKGHAPARLFWLSWRHFEASVRDSVENWPLLEDLTELLVNSWELVWPNFVRWPQAPALISAGWNFTPWIWRSPTARFEWRFEGGSGE